VAFLCLTENNTPCHGTRGSGMILSPGKGSRGNQCSTHCDRDHAYFLLKRTGAGSLNMSQTALIWCTLYPSDSQHLFQKALSACKLEQRCSSWTSPCSFDLSDIAHCLHFHFITSILMMCMPCRTQSIAQGAFLYI